VIWVLNSLKCT